MPNDAWNPAQYDRFREQRMLPFGDLAALIRPAPGARVIDLGCGTGEITALLADMLPGADVLGVDSSAAMLERAAPRARPGLAFRQQDLRDVPDFGEYDLVFSHAALQWVPDHERFLARMFAQLRPGAQVAVQLPKNTQHASHTVAARLASEAAFAPQLAGRVRAPDAPPMERYAEWMHAHGLREQVCFEKIYGHELASAAEVVEWVRGTLLTAYLGALDAPTGQAFVAAYSARLRDAIGDGAPYFYAFRRLLFWGRKG
jgi:trans-aconitate 2-methyltransferase